ncbi:hypothetical protein ACFYT4_28655 [Streptomyces sp. NPDC004609]
MRSPAAGSSVATRYVGLDPSWSAGAPADHDSAGRDHIAAFAIVPA